MAVGYTIPTLGVGGFGGNLLTAYNRAHKSATKANKKRYKQALGELQGVRDRAMQEINQTGEFDRQRIDRQQQQADASAQSNLVGRGLYNTTVVDAARRGNAADAQFQHMGLSDQLARQRAEYDIGTTGAVAGLIERRQDVYPNLGQILPYLQNSQAAGGYQMPGRSTVNVGTSPGGLGMNLMRGTANPGLYAPRYAYSGGLF